VKKRIYFDVFDGRGWPAPNELEHYFLAPPDGAGPLGTARTIAGD
jgi:hypothetical protein